MDNNYVTLQTFTRTSSTTKDPRNVTIWYAHGEFTLLGNLEHATELVINQKLIDDLQRLLNEVKEGKHE